MSYMNSKRILAGIVLILALVIFTGVAQESRAEELIDIDNGSVTLDEWNYVYEESEYGFQRVVGAYYMNQYYSYIYDDRDVIVGITDMSGKEIVRYEYDDSFIVSKVYSYDGEKWDLNTDANFIGNKNRMLYLGYVFDDLTGCYIVNGEYFDPVGHKYVGGTDDPSLYVDVNPFLVVNSGDVSILSSISDADNAAQLWTEALLKESSHGEVIDYSSGWYKSLPTVELLSRAIYAEGGVEYTSEEDAVAWVMLNRVNSSKFPSTPGEVVRQSGQFTTVVGNAQSTKNTREPAIGTARWRHSTYLACLMLTTTNSSDWSALVGDTLNGQLYFYGYSSAKKKYDNGTPIFTGSGSSMKYNGISISNVYVLGYGSVDSFPTLFTNFNPGNSSRNIYYNR